MRYLILAVFLTGCAVTPHDVFKAKYECGIQGSDYEKIETFPSKSVVCQDGSSWSLRSSK